jgi:hypothetical protein
MLNSGIKIRAECDKNAKNETGLIRLMGFHPIFVDFNGVIFFSLFIHVMYMY